MLIVPANLIWPDNDDTVELSILSLLNGHGCESVGSAPAMLPPKRDLTL